jgi:hypothetical protein
MRDFDATLNIFQLSGDDKRPTLGTGGRRFCLNGDGKKGGRKRNCLFGETAVENSLCDSQNTPPDMKQEKQATRLSPSWRPAAFRHRLTTTVALSTFRFHPESEAPAY